jgi:hypothetical protein
MIHLYGHNYLQNDFTIDIEGGSVVQCEHYALFGNKSSMCLMVCRFFPSVIHLYLSWECGAFTIQSPTIFIHDVCH